MNRSTILIVLFCAGTFGIASTALGDEPTPTPAPSNGRHNNPAFAACKKQADDQNIARGEARKDFIRNCMKSAPPTPSP